MPVRLGGSWRASNCHAAGRTDLGSVLIFMMLPYRPNRLNSPEMFMAVGTLNTITTVVSPAAGAGAPYLSHRGTIPTIGVNALSANPHPHHHHRR